MQLLYNRMRCQRVLLKKWQVIQVFKQLLYSFNKVSRARPGCDDFLKFLWLGHSIGVSLYPRDCPG